jgi:hypothetical protein
MGTQLMGLFKSRARNSDPITSHEAAATITTPELLTRMQMVEKLLKAWPMADEELVGLFNAAAIAGLCKMASPQGIRTARANLVKAGKVQAIEGVFAKTEMGNNAHIWKWVG